MKKLGYTFKKKVFRYKEQDTAKVETYKQEIRDIDPKNIVYIEAA